MSFVDYKVLGRLSDGHNPRTPSRTPVKPEDKRCLNDFCPYVDLLTSAHSSSANFFYGRYIRLHSIIPMADEPETGSNTDDV